MAESSFNCSVRQGFNFEKDAQVTVGHIKQLEISGQPFAADIDVTDPENVEAGKVKVVGVLSSIYWGGGYSDPVQFSVQVSNDNQKALAALIHKKMSNTEVKFEFNVYDYDFKAKKYYRCLHCNDTALEGLVMKQGGELLFRSSNEASTEVVSPKNFTLSLGVMPAEKEMQIHLGFSDTDKWAKQFGVTVGG